MAMKINADNVRFIEHKMLEDIPYFECDGDEAKQNLAYIAGVNAMANEVIKTIVGFEVRKDNGK